MSSSSDAIIEAAVVPPGECTGRFERTHHTATTPRQCTQPHTQPRPKPIPTAQGNIAAENRVRGVKIEKPRVTGSWKAAKRRSTHTPHARTTGQTTTHRPKPRVVKPQTTKKQTNHKKQSNHGQTTKTTVKPQKTTVKTQIPQKNCQTTVMSCFF